jgi:hypothetical protein
MFPEIPPGKRCSGAFHAVANLGDRVHPLQASIIDNGTRIIYFGGVSPPLSSGGYEESVASRSKFPDRSR